MSNEILPAKQDTSVTRYNSLRFGLRAQATILPWEKHEDYESLVDSLMQHHAPDGPTEAHLVEEIAGIIWRKQRVALAEGALFRKEMAADVENHSRAQASVQAAVIGKAPAHLSGMATIHLAEAMAPRGSKSTPAQANKTLKEARELLVRIEHETDYEEALKLLPEAVRIAYEQQYLGKEVTRDDEEIYTFEKLAADLAYFMQNVLIPELEGQTLQHRYNEDIAAQLKGQSFNPVKLELISRYETHLDRKLERMLAMLIKMQELRQGAGNE